MYEFFDHTADLGLRVRSTDLDALFREAAEGLFAIIVEDVPVVPGAERMEFRLQGERNDYLLFDWLNELLYVFDTRRLVFRDFVVTVTAEGLTATANAQPLDDSRHRPLHEVKAITYHGLRVEQIDGGWLAELIVDI